MSKFSSKLLEYHTSLSGSEIYLENMKRIHPSLNEDDILGLALLATNPAISEEEREVFKKCLEMKSKQIQKQVEEFNRLLYIKEGSVAKDE
jgi:hypothetical protein